MQGHFQSKWLLISTHVFLRKAHSKECEMGNIMWEGGKKKVEFSDLALQRSVLLGKSFSWHYHIIDADLTSVFQHIDFFLWNNFQVFVFFKNYSMSMTLGQEKVGMCLFGFYHKFSGSLQAFSAIVQYYYCLLRYYGQHQKKTT